MSVVPFSDPRRQLKIDVFKQICVDLSKLSYDDKHCVAAIIFTDNFREICAIGYNGNYAGGPNERDSLDVGKSGFLHGEENALLHLSKPFELRDSLIMLCTHKPCPMCAKRIANSGIKQVYYINEYDALGPQTDEIFIQSGVSLRRV